jgi:hypothetical protein
MKNKFAKLAALVALPLAMNAAFADELTKADRLPVSASSPAVATSSRAAVQADAARALAQGQIVYGEGSYVAPEPVLIVSRATVRAETLQALARHEIVYGERSAPDVTYSQHNQAVAE